MEVLKLFDQFLIIDIGRIIIQYLTDSHLHILGFKKDFNFNEIIFDDPELLKYTIKQNYPHNKNGLFQLVAKQGSLKNMKFLLKRGYPYDGMTFVEAVKHNSPETIGWLLNNNFPCNINLNEEHIHFRILFIKGLLYGKKIPSLINFDQNDLNLNELDTSYFDNKMKDFSEVITQLSRSLFYERTGLLYHIFRGEINPQAYSGEALENTFYYTVKVILHPKEKRFGKTNSTKSINTEIQISRFLSYFVLRHETPHILLPITVFTTEITPFLFLEKRGVVQDNVLDYIKFSKSYQKGEFLNKVTILVSEWVGRDNLFNFIRRYYNRIQLIHWKVLFFQLISTLAVIQSKFPAFRHNNLSVSNVLVHKTKAESKPAFQYRVLKKNYLVPDIKYSIRLWNFDFACIPGIIENTDNSCGLVNDAINLEMNRYFDIHYFFNTFMEEFKSIPAEVQNFIERIVPHKYRRVVCIHKNNSKYKCSICHKFVHFSGQLIINDEYTTPAKILSDPFFSDFVRKEEVIKT